MVSSFAAAEKRLIKASGLGSLVSLAKSIIHNELDLISRHKQSGSQRDVFLFSVWELLSMWSQALNRGSSHWRFPHNMITSDSLYFKGTKTKLKSLSLLKFVKKLNKSRKSTFPLMSEISFKQAALRLVRGLAHYLRCVWRCPDRNTSTVGIGWGPKSELLSMEKSTKSQMWAFMLIFTREGANSQNYTASTQQCSAHF